MNLTFKGKKIKLFEKKHHGVSYEINPLHDWEKIVAAFLILVILVTAIHIYIFLKINKGEIFQTDKVDTTTASAQTVNRVLLKSTVDYYDGEEAKLNDLELNRPTTKDPSK